MLKSFALLLFVVIAQSTSCWIFEVTRYSATTSQFESPPPAEMVVPPPPVLICENLRFTSPRDGLPNGVATFYWDSLANATSYRINIYGDGALRASFDAAGDQTNLTGDVSWNAIGGQFNFEVELLAFDANGNSCRDAVAMQREAPDAPQPPRDVPPPTPTCAEAPTAPYC